MNSKYKFIARVLPLVATVFLWSSCKKFLEESPSKTSSLVVKTTTQINALLDNQNTFYAEENITQSYGTDDCGITLDVYNGGRGVFSYMPAILFMNWDTQYIPDVSQTFWSNEYKKIFVANLALNEVDKVTGTDAEKAVIKADAHLIRAYSYWVLANTYCLPYTEQNKNEPGLPLKSSTSFEEPLERQPLEKVYQQIETDLAEALKVTVSLTQSGKPRHWRASKAGVNGFAARYYLNRNDNAKAISYANAALADYNVLVDYNTEMKYGKDQSITINSGTPTAQTVVLKYPYTHDNQLASDQTDVISWKEFMYFRTLSNGSWWYVDRKSVV